MREPQWLLRETVVALQERLLAEFGGLPGLRDAGLLELNADRMRLTPQGRLASNEVFSRLLVSSAA